MGQGTTIAWTDATFNPWWGCTKVSLGCDNCYAETYDKMRGGGTPHWGKGVPRRTFGDAHWKEPLKWNREAGIAGAKRKVFCASMADVMDDEAPDGQRERLWELIDQTPNLIWQLLTKRPQRYTSYLPPDGFRRGNVWLGTTTENQHFYELRWRVLRIVAADFNCTSFVSYEPALGPLSIIDCAESLPKSSNPDVEDFPDWLICGGETGTGRRVFDLSWAENIADECEASGTKFFMKQMSAHNPAIAAALIPAHLLIRQFPEVL